MNNFDTSRPFGTIDLTSALAYSVNSVFCNIGLKLGAKTILDTAKRFGFYERPPLETPADERLASGLYATAGSSTRRSTRTSTPGAWPSARSGCS